MKEFKLFAKGFPAIYFGGEYRPFIPLVPHKVKVSMGMAMGAPDSYACTLEVDWPGAVEVRSRNLVFIPQSSYRQERLLQSLQNFGAETLEKAVNALEKSSPKLARVVKDFISPLSSNFAPAFIVYYHGTELERKVPLILDCRSLKLVSLVAFRTVYRLFSGTELPAKVDYTSKEVVHFALSTGWATPSLLETWAVKLPKLLPYRFKFVK